MRERTFLCTFNLGITCDRKMDCETATRFLPTAPENSGMVIAAISRPTHRIVTQFGVFLLRL